MAIVYMGGGGGGHALVYGILYGSYGGIMGYFKNEGYAVVFTPISDSLYAGYRMVYIYIWCHLNGGLW